jgi:acetyltransferase-like isoleucine patch superfamily enzyme
VTAFIHPTAIVEAGVEIGAGTAIWNTVHVRSPSRIGADCIIGEKTYIAPHVHLGDRVKVNALAYLCAGVTLEDGVMVSAGVIFTNDLRPRATTPDLRSLLPSDFGPEHRETRVRQGATIGAGSVIRGGIEIGRFAMIGMGSVVTRSVLDFHLVRGNPAAVAGAVCRCGEVIARFDASTAEISIDATCPGCALRYRIGARQVVELSPP